MKSCRVCKKMFEKGKRSLYSVPKDGRRRLLWNNACHIQFTDSAMVCGEHFLPSNFIYGAKTTNLMPNAVPSINLQRPPKFKHKNNRSKHAAGLDATSENDSFENVICLTSAEDEHSAKLTSDHNPQKVLQQLNGTKDFEIISASNTRATTGQTQFLELINEEQFDENEIPEMYDDQTVLPTVKTTTPFDGEDIQNVSEKIHCGFVTLIKNIGPNYYLNCFYCDTEFPINKWIEFCDHIHAIHKDLEAQYEDVDTSIQEMSCHTNSGRVQQVSPLNISMVKCETAENVDPPNQLGVELLVNTSSNVIMDNNIIDVKSEDQEDLEALEALLSADEMEKIDTESVKGEYYQCPDCYNPNLDHNYSQDSYNKKCYIQVNEGNTSKIEYNQIRFGKTDPAIVMDFLERLKLYPCLWYTHLGSIEMYENALEILLDKMNSRWRLNLTKKVLRNNLECIKRYYNTVLENQKRKQYDNYHPKYEVYLRICAEIPNGDDTQNDETATIQSIDPPKALPLPENIRRRFADKKEKCFTCPVCEKGFVVESKFKTHVQLHSKEIRPYKCDICDRYYHTESVLEQHKKRHDPPKHVCSICSKRYSFAYNLEIHMKTHTGTFDYMCEWCGKAFVDKKPYLTHVKYKHNEEGRCSICRQSCQTAAALDKHLKTYHRPLIITDDFKRAIPHQTVTRNKKKIKPGTYRRFSRRYHSIIDPETKKRRICCPNCDKSYLAYDTLYVHIAKIHGYEPVRESFSINRIIKPNPGHFKRKHPMNNKIKMVYKNCTQIENDYNADSRVEGISVEDIKNVDTIVEESLTEESRNADATIEETNFAASCIGSSVVDRRELLFMNRQVYDDPYLEKIDDELEFIMNTDVDIHI